MWIGHESGHPQAVHDSDMAYSTGRITKAGRRDLHRAMVDAANHAITDHAHWKAQFEALSSHIGKSKGHCDHCQEAAGSRLAHADQRGGGQICQPDPGGLLDVCLCPQSTRQEPARGAEHTALHPQSARPAEDRPGGEEDPGGHEDL